MKARIQYTVFVFSYSDDGLPRPLDLLGLARPTSTTFIPFVCGRQRLRDPTAGMTVTLRPGNVGGYRAIRTVIPGLVLRSNGRTERPRWDVFHGYRSETAAFEFTLVSVLSIHSFKGGKRTKQLDGTRRHHRAYLVYRFLSNQV